MMLVTALTKRVRKYRETVNNWIAEGFINVSENGDPLWKFQRGGWTNREIIEVRIAPGGKELWIKVSQH